jgi:hypothetical protein
MNKAAQSWLSPNGASEEVLQELIAAVKGLPTSYLDLLRLGNGGEVGLTVNPYNLCLDSAEAALDYLRSSAYPMQEVFIFGGNGGGELLAFDMRQPAPFPIVCFDPIDPEGSIEQLASSFEEFIALVESEDA